MKPLYVKKNGVVYRVSGTGIPSIYPAANVEYDNTVTSELQATDVQGAIDELSTREAGVQSDWNEDDTTELDYIKNKPQNLVQDASYVHTDNNYDATAKDKVDSLGTASTKNVPASGDASTTQVVMGSDTRLTDARPASDVSAWAKADTKPSYTASEVGAIASTLKGAVNGVAELDAAGKVPSSQLPSFVDDVIEVADYDHLPITGESGKIYVTLDTNKTYRWTGSGYAEISESLALGETSSTAYRGDRGKTAYDHATESGKISSAVTSGLYKVAATAQGHIASLTAVEKSDITALGIPAQDTTYGVVSKTANGLAPQLPNETTTTKYLRQDGTWQVPPNTTYTVATGDANGQIKVTPSSGSAYNVGVKGLGSSAYANLANTVMEVGKVSSRSTATVGTWTAMCNSTQTGSPTLPTASKWWNVVNLNNWTDSSTNWVSQLAVATQDSLSGVWWRANNAGGTSIDSSTWHRLAEGDASGNAANANTVNGLTVQTAVPANAKFTDTTYNFGGTTFYSGNSGTAEHNANSIQYNGDYYYTSNGPATTKGATTTDGGLYAQFHSTTWGGQIAQDYRNGNLFVRGKNNGTLTEWSPIASGLKIAWGRYGTTSSTTKIKINIKPTAAWMLSFVVTIYQGYVARKFMISGYQYGSNHWYSPTAVLLGSSNNTSASVYFGYDSNNNLWVGFDGGNYTGVCISDVCNGYTQLTDLGEMFTISNVSSLTTLQTTVTAGKPDAATVNGLTLSLVT